MAVRWKYLYSSSVGLHIVALIPIRPYFSWFYFLRSERNIESENLPDKVTNLGIFTIWLVSSGCRPHTSSIWPWSGAPKVRLYGTFMSGLRQGTMMFLVVVTVMFVVTKNSVKYGLHTNIIPQEGYEGTKKWWLWTGPEPPPDSYICMYLDSKEIAIKTRRLRVSAYYHLGWESPHSLSSQLYGDWY